MRVNRHEVLLPGSVGRGENKAITKHGKSGVFPSTKPRVSSSNSSVSSPILSKSQLLAMAADLKSGVIDKEQASNRFVAAVIDHSLKGKLGDEDREKLIEDIKEFFASDQEFGSKLSKNLQDLG